MDRLPAGRLYATQSGPLWVDSTNRFHELDEMEIGHLLNSADMLDKKVAQIEQKVCAFHAMLPNESPAWTHGQSMLVGRLKTESHELRSTAKRKMEGLSYGELVEIERSRHAIAAAWAWRRRYERIANDIKADRDTLREWLGM